MNHLWMLDIQLMRRARAHNPDEMRRLREKLADERHISPLFDTPRFVRNLERAYQAMWAVHTSGRPPEPIVVSE